MITQARLRSAEATIQRLLKVQHALSQTAKNRLEVIEQVRALHPKGTINAPVFDEFDYPYRDGCTTCRTSYPCDTLKATYRR